MNNKKINIKGQALVENILLLPILVLIILTLFWFARILITKHMLLTAARYGTDMILYTNLNENQIRQEIRNYLSDTKIRGRILNPKKLTDEKIKIKIEKYQLKEMPDFSSIAGLLKIPQLTAKLNNIGKSILNPMDHTCWVEVYYDFEVPRFIALACGKLNEKFIVSARSEVLAGTGFEN